MTLVLAMAAAAASAPQSVGRLVLNCDMRGPADTRYATQFNLHGTTDGEELKANMSTWLLSAPIELEGGHRLSIEDAVHYYEWNEAQRRDRARLNIKMVEYSRQQSAVLTVVKRYSDGRHTVDTLIGTGMCDARRESPSPGSGQ